MSCRATLVLPHKLMWREGWGGFLTGVQCWSQPTVHAADNRLTESAPCPFLWLVFIAEFSKQCTLLSADWLNQHRVHFFDWCSVLKSANSARCCQQTDWISTVSISLTGVQCWVQQTVHVAVSRLTESASCPFSEKQTAWIQKGKLSTNVSRILIGYFLNHGLFMIWRQLNWKDLEGSNCGWIWQSGLKGEQHQENPVWVYGVSVEIRNVSSKIQIISFTALYSLLDNTFGHNLPLECADCVTIVGASTSCSHQVLSILHRGGFSSSVERLVTDG